MFTNYDIIITSLANVPAASLIGQQSQWLTSSSALSCSSWLRLSSASCERCLSWSSSDATLACELAKLPSSS